MIKKYNGGMGGVDVLDSMVTCYIVRIRKKKCWWAIYSWSLSASAVNEGKDVKKEKMPFLEFLCQLIMELLMVHGTARYTIYYFNLPTHPRQDWVKTRNIITILIV